MPAKRPNILIITTHDTGRHLGCYGVPTIHTPNIDALAGEGVLFTNMFGTSPVCSPSRGSLMTGQYPQRHGMMGLAGGPKSSEMFDYSRHLSHVLRRNGYATQLFGYHHETADTTRLGFDGDNAFEVPEAHREKRDAIRVARQFERFVDAGLPGDKPFYAQIGFYETHTPFNWGGVEPDDSKGTWIPPYAMDMDARKAFRGLSGVIKDAENEDSLRKHIAGFQGSARTADEAVGLILAALRRAGVERDTIVLYNTDHGVELPRAKWTLYDPGVSIAFVMRWPSGGVTGGRRCDWLLSNVDFVPTLVKMIGIKVEQALDGMSFAAAALGRSDATPPARDGVYTEMHYGDVRALRTEHFKLLRCLKFGTRKTSAGYEGRYPFELFDLRSDPLELRDVSKEPAYAGTLAELTAMFWAKLEALNDPILRTPLTEPAPPAAKK